MPVILSATRRNVDKRYMDDVACAASCSEENLSQFFEFASSFHPNLEYTWSVSTDKLPFLDICMKPRSNRIATSIHYKATDSHSYLSFSPSHPHSCIKSSIPYTRFLRLRKFCRWWRWLGHRGSENGDLSFLAARGYPNEGEGNGIDQTKGWNFEVWRCKQLTSLMIDYLLSPPSTPVTLMPRKSSQGISGSLARIARQAISLINHHWRISGVPRIWRTC